LYWPTSNRSKRTNVAIETTCSALKRAFVGVLIEPLFNRRAAETDHPSDSDDWQPLSPYEVAEAFTGVTTAVVEPK
jgi:hypothetical protein